MQRQIGTKNTDGTMSEKQGPKPTRAQVAAKPPAQKKDPLLPPPLRFLPERPIPVSYVRQDVYRSLEITASVKIAGRWREAVIDQTRDSIIDSRLIPEGTDMSQWPRPNSHLIGHMNSALFTWDDSCAEVPMTFSKAAKEAFLGGEKEIEINPTLAHKPGEGDDYTILLGRDVFLQSHQAHGCQAALDNPGHIVEGGLRLLDETAVAVFIKAPRVSKKDSPVGSGPKTLPKLPPVKKDKYLPLDDDQTWRQYW